MIMIRIGSAYEYRDTYQFDLEGYVPPLTFSDSAMFCSFSKIHNMYIIHVHAPVIFSDISSTCS